LLEWSESNELLEKFLNLKINKAYLYGVENSDMPVLKILEDKVKLIQISNSGHFMMLDNPIEFYNTLIKTI